MNAQILTNINNFMKNRFIEILGITLIFISFFLLISIISYSPSDPNFIYSPENSDIKNFGGFYGSVLSDILLQSLGLVSILLIINFLYWGFKILKKNKINKFTVRVFFTFVYMIFGTTLLNITNNNFVILINGNNNISN